MISESLSLKSFIHLICTVLFLCNLPVPSLGQSKESTENPRMKSSIFGREVLFPDKITVRADGTPVYGIEAAQMALSVLAIRGADQIYFQVDILNESHQPFEFDAMSFGLLSDQGFRIQGLNSSSVVASLSAKAQIPPPAPPPAPPPSQVSHTTIETTTRGRVDSFGNIRANTTGTATTTTTTDPQTAYKAGAAGGQLLAALLARGARNREKQFIEELSAYGYSTAVVMPNEKQRFYLTYGRVKSNYFDLQLPSPFNQKIRFYLKKPNGVEDVPKAITSRTESKEQNTQVAKLSPEPHIPSRPLVLSADDYNQEGMKLFSLNRFGEAERVFRQAVKLEANNALYHYNLGTAINMQLRHEEAEREMALAVRLAPNVEAYGKGLEIVRLNRRH